MPDKTEKSWGTPMPRKAIYPRYKKHPVSATSPIRHAFNRHALSMICETHELDFGAVFNLDRVQVSQDSSRISRGEDYYYFQDNGSSILAVAHLDTVAEHHERKASYVETEAGLVVFSRALDDRLGAYVILDLLPRLGITCDILLTVGEESGCSTAQFFEPPPGKDYNWMIEFDRGGTDVVMYQYDDCETSALVEEVGAQVGSGSFSDIAYLEHLEIKGFNWGVGYGGDYHGPRAHAFLEDTFMMVERFTEFHTLNAEEYLPHESYDSYWGSRSRRWDDDWVETARWQDTENEHPALTAEQVAEIMLGAEVIDGEVVDDGTGVPDWSGHSAHDHEVDPDPEDLDARIEAIEAASTAAVGRPL